MGQDGRHAAGFGRHDRQPARECFDDGRRHVVDVRALQVDVVRRRRSARCRPGQPVRRTSRPAGRAPERAFEGDPLPSPRRPASASRREPLLDELECADRARHVVEAVEVAGRQNARPERIAIAKPEPVECRPCSGSRWRRCRTWRTLRRGNATARRSAGPIAPPTARPAIARDGRVPRRCGSSGRPAGRAAAPREWPAGARAGTRSTMPRIRGRRRPDGGGGQETGYR